MNTEIILPVSELKSALPGLNKVVTRKTSLPVLQNVKVGRDQHGQVTLQATDLHSFATYSVTGTQPGEPVELLLPLAQLNQAFKSSGSADDLALVCEGDATKLRYPIAGSPVHQPVNVTPANEWPPVPQIKAECFKLDPAFGPAFRQALECCSEDATRHVLKGVCLDVSDAACHYIVGTDARCLFAANSFTFPLKQSLIIPNSRFLSASGLAPLALSVQSSGTGRNTLTHVCLHSARWQFITREIDGQFPNWKQSLPSINSRWTLVKLGPHAVSQLLRVIPRLPGEADDHHPVRLRIDKCLWVEGRNRNDQEWTKVAVADVNVTGKSQTVLLNRLYLLQALKFGLDELAVEAEGRPLVFSKAGTKFVIKPIGQKPAAPAPDAPAPVLQTPPTATITPETNPAHERKTEMPQAAKPNELSALEQVEAVKGHLRQASGGLTRLAGLLKQADKDKRSTAKEVASVRQTLRSLQGLKL
jgi:DNA polymerase III sliding clamp (beta) subunit (PCNA family)